MTDTTVTKTVFLRGDTPSADPTEREGQLNSVRAAVFGQLAQLAAAHVKAYWSDLYHDAAWLQTHLNEPMQFFYSVRESGTLIGTDYEYVVHGMSHIAAYRIVVALRGKYKDLWEMEITEVVE